MIHPTALIDPSAKLADSVEVGAYSIIGADVEIGEKTWIGPHVVIQGPTKIGRENKLFQFSSIGEVPQDKKFHGETSYLEIGDRNTIREFATINRGTEDGGGTTRIGNDNWLMAYIHIAHDCQVGDNTIFANNASLAGHAIIEDYVILGGFTLVHQFCSIGQHAFCGMGSAISKDIPPYVMVIDEAHLFVPQNSSSPCKQIIREGVRIGRHHGICLVLMTQSPVDIDKSTIRQCNTRLVFALEADQLEAIRGVKADATEEMLRALPKMPQGTCLMSGTYESVKHAIPVKIRKRNTPDSEGGSAPKIFDEMQDKWIEKIENLKKPK